MTTDPAAGLARLNQVLDRGTGGPAWDTWVRETARLLPQMSLTPAAGYIYQLALHVFAERDAAAAVHQAAIRDLSAQLTEARSEIARLKAEADTAAGTNVVHCLERDMERLISSDQLAGEADGTILRATDTGREIRLADGMWLITDLGEPR